jgi:hypothetical protein
VKELCQGECILTSFKIFFYLFDWSQQVSCFPLSGKKNWSLFSFFKSSKPNTQSGSHGDMCRSSLEMSSLPQTQPLAGSVLHLSWVTVSEITVRSCNSLLQHKPAFDFIQSAYQGLVSILLRLVKSWESLLNKFRYTSWIAYLNWFRSAQLTSSECVLHAGHHEVHEIELKRKQGELPAIKIFTAHG